MRLYRFLNSDRSIDVTVVTDGCNDQKKVFITESPRGVIAPGQVMEKDEKDLGVKLIEMGFTWKAGEEVTHEELVAFANKNSLELIIDPQGLNEVTNCSATWISEETEIAVDVQTTIPSKKLVEIEILGDKTFNESVGRYGELLSDTVLSVLTLNGHPVVLTLADMNLSAKEEVKFTVSTNGGIQSFELAATPTPAPAD